jgi:hypothetical protein
VITMVSVMLTPGSNQQAAWVIYPVPVQEREKPGPGGTSRPSSGCSPTRTTTRRKPTATTRRKTP